MRWVLVVATLLGAAPRFCSPRAQAQRPPSRQAPTASIRSLEALIGEAEALGARTGVAVRDLEGRPLALHRAAEAFVPASNLKLLTAAAVLRGLGADFRFRTRFALRDGRLAVQASGDPNWITGTADAPSLVFGAVAAALQRAGVTAIRGIDLEPGVFHGPLRPASWPQDQLDTYYCAPTGPFVLEQGTFALTIRAGNGSAHVALAAPAAAVPLRGSIAMAAAKRGATYGAIDLGDAVKISGRFWQRSPPVTIRTAVRDPATWFAAALRHALLQAGIAESGEAPAATAALPAHQTELGSAIVRMLCDSSNFDAEQCLRVLGAQRGDGSLAGGLGALRAELEAMVGNLPPAVVLVDGSGLSRANRVTAAFVVEVLAAALRGAGAESFQAALPVAGESGTLEDRFARSPVEGRVFAKTGWIRGASALSGVLRRGDGTLRLFAILMNYDRDPGGLVRRLKDLQERIVEAVDALPAGDRP
jgi:D-alanyl-D-alanine carboxypeptidase/D-alanyl-D-alanine-endopeptidase (penicillin-binding protein 4)